MIESDGKVCWTAEEAAELESVMRDLEPQKFTTDNDRVEHVAYTLGYRSRILGKGFYSNPWIEDGAEAHNTKGRKFVDGMVAAIIDGPTVTVISDPKLMTFPPPQGCMPW